MSTRYTGRFAPTPSGPLHFGSICTALGSYLDARSRQGRWLLRVDDLDAARVMPGATAHIQRSLERLGLHWDGEVVLQGSRLDAYHAALETLIAGGQVYPCTCSRARVRGRPYPGTCRDRHSLQASRQYSTRLRLASGMVSLDDRLRGRISRDISSTTGDFIVNRADNVIAYHLASVVDDDWLGVTDIVRGGDLVEASLCQVYLQDCLHLHRPRYLHLPLAVHRDGRKISKSADDLDALLTRSPSQLLLSALRFLGHVPDRAMENEPVTEILRWATGAWDLNRVPVTDSIVVPD